METKAYMYVLECADGSLYTGKGAKYTRTRLPVTLLYQEEFPDKPSAMSAEALFKRKTRQQKLEYIADKKK